MNRFFSTILAIISTLLLAALCCVPQPLDPGNPQWDVHVTNFKVTYDGTSVTLSWSKPDSAFDFYRVYRTRTVDSLGKPDLSTMVSVEARDSISKMDTTFVDILEPADGVYYYTMCPVKFVGGKNIEGLRSNIDSCVVGTGTHFSINNGDLFTVSNICTLFVKDPWLKISSVRFTQLTIDSIDTTPVGSPGQLVPVTQGNPTTYPGDLYGQIADLVSYGFVVSGQGNIKRFVAIPNFDDTALNATRRGPFPISQTLTGFPWVLLPGSGEKTVYEEITYKNGVKDTVFDQIKTAPHKVEITFRNKTGFGADGATMRDTSDTIGGGNTELEIFYSPELQFSVKIFGDSAIGTSFQSWIMVDSSQALRPPNYWVNDANYLWYMTVPQQYHLTGRGDLHNSDTAYSFSIRDTTVPQNTILKCQLLGVKGAVDASPDDNFKNLTALTTNYLTKTGVCKKQFYFVTRFTEQFFGGQFLYIYGVTDTTVSLTTCFDFYLPVMNQAPSTICNIGEGSVITGPFSFALDTNPSVFDSGYSRITNIRLVIAKKPDDWVWDDTSAANVAQYTPDVLLNQFRSQSYDFPIQVQQTSYRLVEWDNIDPSQWPSGTYLMGVLVTDEFGQSGFANMWNTSSIKKWTTNPWSVQIHTSQ